MKIITGLLLIGQAAIASGFVWVLLIVAAGLALVGWLIVRFLL